MRFFAEKLPVAIVSLESITVVAQVKDAGAG
jgi:hypothetical protein